MRWWKDLLCWALGHKRGVVHPVYVPDLGEVHGICHCQRCGMGPFRIY
jgi:hypothetical protein